MFNFQEVSTIAATSLAPKVTLKHSSSKFIFTQGAIQKIGYDKDNEGHAMAIYVDPVNKVVAFKLQEGGKKLAGKDNNSFSNKIAMESVMEITKAEELRYVTTEGDFVIFNETGSLDPQPEVTVAGTVETPENNEVEPQAVEEEVASGDDF